MESIGDLLRVMPAGKNIAEQARRKLEELSREPLVQKLRSEYPGLDDAVMRQNLNKLYQYVNEHRSCSNCPGLDQCPNDYEGHYTMISCEELNGSLLLHDRKVACKKLIARRNEDQVKRRIRSFYVDETALQAGYSANEILSNDMERAKAVASIMRYINQTAEEGLQPKGLYLGGKFGTGKTFLMGYMLHELAKTGYSGVIVYMPEFVEDLKTMFGEPHKLKETVDLMKEADLLVFDDIGAENLNPWVRDHVMGTILNYRMNRKPTFYTSNLDLDALQRHFSFTSKDGDEAHKGERIMDRVRPFVEYVLVTGRNKRG